MNAVRNSSGGALCVNRRALRDYLVLETHEAGIALQGTEVKVLRAGLAGLQGAYADIHDGQVWLHRLTIPPYDFGNRFNHELQRTRRLLMRKPEIRRLSEQLEQKGLSLIPLRMYLKRGRVKVDLALCRGKTQHDKRETMRQREAERETDQAIAQHWRG